MNRHRGCIDLYASRRSLGASRRRNGNLIISFSLILRRIPEAVEAVGFKLLYDDALALLLAGHGDRLGQKPNLPDEAGQGQIDHFKEIHRAKVPSEGRRACWWRPALGSWCASHYSQNF